MKTIYALYMSWRYWFSFYEEYTCVWLSDCWEYRRWLDNRIGYEGDNMFTSWRSSYKLQEHRDFKHMTPWQLRHARRKLIYEFFLTRSE